MRYTPLEQHVRTLYVPEDFIDRLVVRAVSGKLFPGPVAVAPRVVRRQGDHLRLYVPDRTSARFLRFNVLDVWRLDNQTIQYRVCYRPARNERIREWWRSAPSPPVLVIMLPVIAVLAFIVPEVLLMPLIGLGARKSGRNAAMPPLGRQLKAIADGAA